MTKFILNDYHKDIPEDELIKDILKVKNILNVDAVTIHKYNEFGKYSAGTMIQRFGTWNKALEKAGLTINNQFYISNEELFKNLEEVWTKLGRQPQRREMRKPLSMFSESPYRSHFGSWRKALEKFVEYINTTDEESESEDIIEKNQEVDISTEDIIHKTKRGISDRLRFSILLRDGFTCCKCGRSPLKERDIELHVDHIVPWSKGGETISDNLETKCAKCNLGKGNAFNV